MAKKDSKRRFKSARERVAGAAAQAGPGSGGGTMFKNIPKDMEFFSPECPKGKTAVKYTLRLLPYIVTDPHHPDGEMAPAGEIWYKRPFKRYRQLGNPPKPYISPLSVGKPDPVAELYKKAKSDPSIPEEQANKFKPQDCVAYNVQVVEKGKVGPVQFFFFGYHNFERQLKVELNDPDNEEFLGFMDLEGGFDVQVRFQKESFGGHDFLRADSISFVERDDIDESILDEVLNLDDILIIKSFDELNNIVLEIDDNMPAADADDPGPDPDDAPEARRERKKLATKEPVFPGQKRERKAKPEPEPEPEEEPVKLPELDQEELEDMSKKAMIKFIDKNELDIDTEGMDEDEVRAALNDLYGFKETDEEESEPEPEKPKAGKKADGKAEKGKAKNDDRCPHGHEFATDCDKHKDCDKCDAWEDCMEEQEANK